jgi:hypothetical protein
VIAGAHAQHRENLVRVAARDLDAIALGEDSLDEEARLTQV